MAAPDRWRITGAGFLHCTGCGSMVMEGYRGEHSAFHDVLDRLLAADVPNPADR